MLKITTAACRKELCLRVKGSWAAWGRTNWVLISCSSWNAGGLFSEKFVFKRKKAFACEGVWWTQNSSSWQKRNRRLEHRTVTSRADLPARCEETRREDREPIMHPGLCFLLLPPRPPQQGLECRWAGNHRPLHRLWGKDILFAAFPGLPPSPAEFILSVAQLCEFSFP